MVNRHARSRILFVVLLGTASLGAGCGNDTGIDAVGAGPDLSVPDEPGPTIEPTVTGAEAIPDRDYLFSLLRHRREAPTRAGPSARLIDILPNTHGLYVDAAEPVDGGELAPGHAIVIGTITEVRSGTPFRDLEDAPSPVPVDDPADADYSTLLLTIRIDEHFGDAPADSALTSGIVVVAGVDAQRFVNGLHAIGPALFVVTDISTDLFSPDVWSISSDGAMISPLTGDGEPFAFPVLSDTDRHNLTVDSPTLADLRQRAAEPVRYRNIVHQGDSWRFVDDPNATSTTASTPSTAVDVGPTPPD